MDRTEEFVRLWLANARQTYAFVLALVGSRADADEVFQDVSITLWEKFASFELGTDFRAWTFCVARNKVMSFRQLKRHQVVTFSTELVELIASQTIAAAAKMDHDYVALDECLEKLETYQRQLINLRYRQNLRIAAIAAQVEKSIDSVYKSFQRIHRSLLVCLTQNVVSEPGD
ncbi:MAG: sigma-70 family RNA polymerase sigma factor [Pirellulales bacterium]